MNALLLFLMFFALLFIGAPIALALGGSSLLYLLFIAHMSPVVVFQQMLSGVNSYTLLAVPLFMMAGSLMEHGGISKRLVSRRPGHGGHRFQRVLCRHVRLRSGNYSRYRRHHDPRHV